MTTRSGEQVLRIRRAPRWAEWRAVLLVLALAAGAAGVRAQEIEPRAYSNIPMGINFLIAGYGYAEGGLVTDPALPLGGIERHVLYRIIRILPIFRFLKWVTSGEARLPIWFDAFDQALAEPQASIK